MMRVLGENLNQGIQFHENAAQTDCRIRGDLKEAVCYCRGVRIPSSHLCYEPDHFFMNSSLPLAFRLLPYFFLLPTMTTLIFLGQSSTAEDLPAWKKGLSTWNGTNYEAPTSSNAHHDFTLPTEAPKLRPYTIPSDPRNTSDTAGKPGRTIGDGNSSDGGHAPEDIQTLPKLDALAWSDEAARIRNSTSASNTGITNDQPIKWPASMQAVQTGIKPQQLVQLTQHSKHLFQLCPTTFWKRLPIRTQTHRLTVHQCPIRPQPKFRLQSSKNLPDQYQKKSTPT